jgi:acyl carrier protein
VDAIETQVIEIIIGVIAGKGHQVTLTPTSMMGDPTEWDSIAFVEIFLAVSSHFDVEVSDDDAMAFMSVPEIVEFVSQRL